jgi:hypothetical protein
MVGGPTSGGGYVRSRSVTRRSGRLTSGSNEVGAIPFELPTSWVRYQATVR